MLVDEKEASRELRPGRPDGREPHLPPFETYGGDGRTDPLDPTHAIGERSRREQVGRGDTVHVDAVDRDGLMISATPSGGGVRSPPPVPALALCLGGRGPGTWPARAWAPR